MRSKSLSHLWRVLGPPATTGEQRRMGLIERAGLLSWAGAVFWGAIVGLRVRQAISGDEMGILLALQAGVARTG